MANTTINSCFDISPTNVSSSRAKPGCQEQLLKKMNIVDHLITEPSSLSFTERIKKLRISESLIEKAIEANSGQTDPSPILNKSDENELSTEVLLLRHKFTEIVCTDPLFRQTAITIIQNLYLFQQRKIFLTSPLNGDAERQEALLFLSELKNSSSVPLAKTFQHYVLSRIWNRINHIHHARQSSSKPYQELNEVVLQLNSLRNIYVVLCINLVKKLTSRFSKIYQNSISKEDAYQIGAFGIARAAYRFSSSDGFRFSTYATKWIQKEIQRQSLASRLIKISTSSVEQYAKATKNNDRDRQKELSRELQNKTAQLHDFNDSDKQYLCPDLSTEPGKIVEKSEMLQLLPSILKKALPSKKQDIVKRRYGMSPYHEEQSVIEIAQQYGVTRSAIYQLEKSSMELLKKYCFDFL